MPHQKTNNWLHYVIDAWLSCTGGCFDSKGTMLWSTQKHLSTISRIHLKLPKPHLHGEPVERALEPHPPCLPTPLRPAPWDLRGASPMPTPCPLRPSSASHSASTRWQPTTSASPTAFSTAMTTGRWQTTWPRKTENSSTTWICSWGLSPCTAAWSTWSNTPSRACTGCGTAPTCHRELAPELDCALISMDGSMFLDTVLLKFPATAFIELRWIFSQHRTMVFSQGMCVCMCGRKRSCLCMCVRYTAL